MTSKGLRFFCFFWLFMGASTSAIGKQSPPILIIGLILSLLAVCGILGSRLAALLLLAFWGIALLATVVLTFAGYGSVVGNLFLCLLYGFFALVALAGYEPVDSGEESPPTDPQAPGYCVLVPLEPSLLVL